MYLIVGGRGQGKLEYVKNTACKAIAGVADCEFDRLETLFLSSVIYKLHFLVKRLMETEEEPISYIMERLRDDHIVICDEVGSGVVPIDKKEREYRDLVGSLCCEIAEKASCVDRICCGIPMRLK